MGFTNTILEHPKPHQAQPDCAQKTASRKFFSYPVKTSYKNRSNSLKTSQEKSIYTYKIASGRGIWPGRDPIEEDGGVNLYAFVENDPIGRWDKFGKDAEHVGGGVYKFVVNPDHWTRANRSFRRWNLNHVFKSLKGCHINHPNQNYSGQCATGAQAMTGTYGRDGWWRDAAPDSLLGQ